MKRRKEVNWDKTKTWTGTSVKVKVVDIDEKTREGKIRRTSKQLVGCM